MKSLWVISVVLACSSGSLAEEFSDAEWAETKALERVVESRAPRASSHYLYVGRALAPLAAYTALRGEGTQTELPLTLFWHDPPPGPGDPVKRYTSQVTKDLRPLNPSERERFFLHLDRLLPTDAELGGKKLVVLDYFRSGSSLEAFLAYLEIYRSERKRSFAVHVVPLKSAWATGSSPWDSIDMASFPSLNRGMERKVYRSLSSVGEWRVTSFPPPGPVPNEAPHVPRAFRAQLAARMTADGIAVGCPAAWSGAAPAGVR